MDDFNPNPALHLTNGKKVRLPIDSKFRDTTADFTFPSSSIREKVARKVFYKLSLPAELLAFESVPAVAILVTLSALVTEDDYSKVVSILNSDLRLKTIYGNFIIVCACVSYEKLWGSSSLRFRGTITYHSSASSTWLLRSSVSIRESRCLRPIQAFVH